MQIEEQGLISLGGRMPDILVVERETVWPKGRKSFRYEKNGKKVSDPKILGSICKNFSFHYEMKSL